MTIKPLDLLIRRMQDDPPAVLHPAAANHWNITRVDAAAAARDYIHPTLKRQAVNALTGDATSPRLRVLNSAEQLRIINGDGDVSLCLYLALCHRNRHHGV